MGETPLDPPPDQRAAFYAARPGGWRDWWTLLHPPYTAWHLAYVVIGACLAPVVNATRLIGTLMAFFFAVGLAATRSMSCTGDRYAPGSRRAHSSSSLVSDLPARSPSESSGSRRSAGPWSPSSSSGRYSSSPTTSRCLAESSTTMSGSPRVGAPFQYLPPTSPRPEHRPSPLIAAVGAAALSAAQRALSRPARLLRRKSADVTGTIALADGGTIPVDRSVLLAPLEQALRAMSWALVMLATALAVDRLR